MFVVKRVLQTQTMANVKFVYIPLDGPRRILSYMTLQRTPLRYPALTGSSRGGRPDPISKKSAAPPSFLKYRRGGGGVAALSHDAGRRRDGARRRRRRVGPLPLNRNVPDSDRL